MPANPCRYNYVDTNKKEMTAGALALDSSALIGR
jgi:hypothetical protein